METIFPLLKKIPYIIQKDGTLEDKQDGLLVETLNYLNESAVLDKPIFEIMTPNRIKGKNGKLKQFLSPLKINSPNATTSSPMNFTNMTTNSTFTSPQISFTSVN